MVSFTAMGRLMAASPASRNLRRGAGADGRETFPPRSDARREAALKTITRAAADSGEIRFRGVKFTGDREILHGVDLDIHATGVTTALVGGWVAARAPL
jgi:hypothetical protein